MLFVVLCPGTPEGSTGSGYGFKASQKTGQRQTGTDCEKLGIDPPTPGLQDIGLSPTQPSEFIIFGQWKYNRLNFMSMVTELY